MNRKITYQWALLLGLLLSAMTVAAQEPDAEKATLERAVDIYFEGTNEVEFYKAVERYREYTKKNNDMKGYYDSWQKEIHYDTNHNHFNSALRKTEALKDEMKAANANKYYYIIDYMMGVFYGKREDNVLAKQHLQQAAALADSALDQEALLQIYQTLANICIFKNLEESYEGYGWADKAIAISKTPEDKCASLSLKAMVAFGHNDKLTFNKYYNQVEELRAKHPDKYLDMYRRYIEMGRAAYDGKYDKAIAISDSIRDEVGRLYFQATIYNIEGDVQRERDVLLNLLKAKDTRNNEVSTLIVNDINQDLLMEQERLNTRRIQMIAYVAITAIIAVTVLLLFRQGLRWREKRRTRKPESLVS